MTRHELRLLVGQKRRLHATFGGSRVSSAGKLRLLLTRVTDADTDFPLAGHCWIRASRAMMKLGLREGERIAFRATIVPYPPGMREDYRLIAVLRARRVQEQEGSG